jgi:twitching motility protein PilT
MYGGFTGNDLRQLILRTGIFISVYSCYALPCVNRKQIVAPLQAKDGLPMSSSEQTINDNKEDIDTIQYLATLLKFAMGKDASDIHLRTRTHPVVRIDGKLQSVERFPATSPAFMKDLTDKIIPGHNKEAFEDLRQADFSFGLKGIGRVRANAYYQRGSISMALRVINTDVPEPEALGLPETVRRFVHEERGLILMTGATGSGKSTSLASLIGEINRTYAKHILTIEDPVEYLFSDNKSIISQREVGVDTMSFPDAMRAALREDPDVILLGEMRDPETIDIALTAAETGHLVFSTLHSPDAAETINRIISSFQPNAQQTIRSKLAGNLKGVVSQRLLPTADGKGRALAAEVMTVSALVREFILDPLRVAEIGDVIKKGTAAEGMIPFDRSLLELFRKGEITEDTALQYASSPTDLKLKLEGF